MFLKEGEEEEKQSISPPKIKLNDKSMGKEIVSDLYEKFPKTIAFPDLQELNGHLEILFTGDNNLIKQNFATLKKFL